MNNMCRLGQQDVLQKLNTLVERKNVAIEKDYINNTKYSSVILELDFRINMFKNIMLCMNVLPYHLDDLGQLILKLTKFNLELFKAKAGHENEDQMISYAMSQALQQHEDINVAVWGSLEVFTGEYDTENKLQMHIDAINFLAHTAKFFLLFREIVCKIGA